MQMNSHQQNNFVEFSENVTVNKEAPVAREAEVMLSVNGEVWLGLALFPG